MTTAVDRAPNLDLALQDPPTLLKSPLVKVTEVDSTQNLEGSQGPDGPGGAEAAEGEGAEGKDTDTLGLSTGPDPAPRSEYFSAASDMESNPWVSSWSSSSRDAVYDFAPAEAGPEAEAYAEQRYVSQGSEGYAEEHGEYAPEGFQEEYAEEEYRGRYQGRYQERYQEEYFDKYAAEQAHLEGQEEETYADAQGDEYDYEREFADDPRLAVRVDSTPSLTPFTSTHETTVILLETIHKLSHGYLALLEMKAALGMGEEGGQGLGEGEGVARRERDGERDGDAEGEGVKVGAGGETVPNGKTNAGPGVQGQEQGQGQNELVTSLQDEQDRTPLIDEVELERRDVHSLVRRAEHCIVHLSKQLELLGPSVSDDEE